MTVHHGCRQILKAVQAHIGRLYAQTAGTASLEADNDTGKAVAKLYPLISTSAERKKKLKQLSSWRRQCKQIELMRGQHKGVTKTFVTFVKTLFCLVMSKNTSHIHRFIFVEEGLHTDSITYSCSYMPRIAQCRSCGCKFRAEVCEMIAKYNISTVLNADQTGEMPSN
ncbi:nuclease SbcC [Phytophthora palmivora]|uniref:Nuclease SbcC n=1 Tax=Phytophthora palmivora TaxID=4796 RepID=A0A2P4XDX1_9STRA|nr:nuclease SbcC [Phytophthora palmivora]